MPLYRLELSDRASKVLDSVRKPGDRKAIDGALAQLEINPKDLKFWTSKHDSNGMHIFTGPKDDWKITFGIIEGARIVYVHSIKPRPSLAFVPGSKED
jgi:hypothetical protein